jgi:hypothetical protein
MGAAPHRETKATRWTQACGSYSCSRRSLRSVAVLRRRRVTSCSSLRLVLGYADPGNGDDLQGSTFEFVLVGV